MKLFNILMAFAVVFVLASCEKSEPISIEESYVAPFEVGHVLTKEEAVSMGFDVSNRYDNFKPVEHAEASKKRSVDPHTLRVSLKAARNLYYYKENISGALVYVAYKTGKTHTVEVPPGEIWYSCLAGPDDIPAQKWEVVNPANGNFQAILGFYDEQQNCWGTSESGIFYGWNDEFSVMAGGVTASCSLVKATFDVCP